LVVRGIISVSNIVVIVIVVVAAAAAAAAAAAEYGMVLADG
jgi:hypothetical protein